jgi:DNA-binding transcriptional MerR regulator
MSVAEDGWMTIEKLSLRSGVTTRNIRAYQSRGLLPAPVSRSGARSAFYTSEHLARLRLVSRLQDRGFSLAGIADLLDALVTGKSIEQVLGIESAMMESEDDQSQLVSESELVAVLPEGIDREATIKQLLAVGLIDRHQRKYRVRYPSVFQLGVDAAQAGIPIKGLIDEFVRLRGDLHEIALRFVALFAAYVLRPYVEAGLPKEGLPLIVERIKHLRQLAVEATAALMRQSMADEIEAVARANLPTASADTATKKRRHR